MAEGEVLTALDNYKTSKPPTPVEAAIGKSVSVLKKIKAGRKELTEAAKLLS